MSKETEVKTKLVQVNNEEIKNHVDLIVRDSVQEALNALLDEEAEQICNAQKYERSPDRVDSRAGHYNRKLQTKAGEVKSKVPKLRRLRFETWRRWTVGLA